MYYFVEIQREVRLGYSEKVYIIDHLNTYLIF